MVEPPFGALLVPAIGAAPLMAPCLLTASEATITLTAVTVGTQKEQRTAFGVQTNPWSQHYFASSRHAFSQAALDNGYGPVSG